MCPFVEGTQQAAAATAGLEYVRAGAATDLHDALVTDGVFYLNAFGDHLRFGMETGCGAGAAAIDLLDATLFQDTWKPGAATDSLDARGSTAIVLGDNGVLNSTCMMTLSVAGAANSLDFKGEESAKSHGETTSVQGDTGSIAFSAMQHSLIRGCHHNSFHHPIHACAHSRLDRCGVGVGVSGVGVACPLLLSLLCVSRVDDDVDDACMDGSNSLKQGSGSHATACACSDALQNSRQVRGHCLGEEQSVRVWVQGPRFGFLMRLRVPYLIRSQKVCMSRRGLVRKYVSPRRVSRSGIFQLGVLQCPSLIVVLFSLLRYLGQAVKLENNWVGYKWRKQKGLGCGFSGAPFKGRIFFLPLPILETGLKRGRTAQRGRSLGIPCARAHMRMGMAQLSGHTRESGVGYCSRGCGGLSLP